MLRAWAFKTFMTEGLGPVITQPDLCHQEMAGSYHYCYGEDRHLGRQLIPSNSSTATNAGRFLFASL